MSYTPHPTQCLSTSCEVSSSTQRRDTPLQANWMKQINSFANFFALVLQRRAQRRALMRLSDTALADIGLTRTQAEEEYRNSFPLL